MWDWVGPGTGLEAVEKRKTLPCQDSNPSLPSCNPSPSPTVSVCTCLTFGLRMRNLAKCSGLVVTVALNDDGWCSLKSCYNPHSWYSQYTRPNPLQIVLRAARYRNMDSISICSIIFWLAVHDINRPTRCIYCEVFIFARIKPIKNVNLSRTLLRFYWTRK